MEATLRLHRPGSSNCDRACAFSAPGRGMLAVLSDVRSVDVVQTTLPGAVCVRFCKPVLDLLCADGNWRKQQKPDTVEVLLDNVCGWALQEEPARDLPIQREKECVMPAAATRWLALHGTGGRWLLTDVFDADALKYPPWQEEKAKDAEPRFVCSELMACVGTEREAGTHCMKAELSAE